MIEYDLPSFLLRNLLRITTVEEINKLIGLSSDKEKVPLTDIVNREMAEKYSSFSLHQKSQREKKTSTSDDSTEASSGNSSDNQGELTPMALKCQARCQQLLEYWSEKFAEMDKNLLTAKRLPKHKEVIGQKQVSAFILEEKKKIEDSLSKLKKREVVELYNKAASFDLEIEKANQENNSPKFGTLINRKQG